MTQPKEFNGIIYTPLLEETKSPQEGIDIVAEKMLKLAQESGKPVRTNFDGINLTIQPDDYCPELTSISYRLAAARRNGAEISWMDMSANP